MNNAPHVFGIRHLSPGGAWHLCNFLDQIQPDIILIEGLSDADDLIEHITSRRTKPPIAILAYTEVLPVRTLVYPLARYSPEYQALCWAKSRDIAVRFIDLPSDIFLAFSQIEYDLETKPTGKSFYEKFALQAGEPDYETYWERNFEHNLGKGVYQSAALQLGAGLREIKDQQDYDSAQNLVREAYMRRQIKKVMDEGYHPGKIVIVVGAYHAPVMGLDHHVLKDDEFEKLPQINSRLTLMPYSYFKLSSQSGYGAGNHAPLYFELVWNCIRAQDPTKIALEYLSRIVRNLRESGTSRSTAEVIEAVRLANTLAALKNGLGPTLCDLQDAAVSLIGQGQRTIVAEAMAHVEVGTAIGELPHGISQTSIQDDFTRELKCLKLDKYRTTIKQTIDLDLRENRRVKSEAAAFLDLNRSFFLHQLIVLGISFAKKIATRQTSATWAEAWTLQWTPESEIALVEAVLMGETIELATAYCFKSRLDESKSIDEAALIIRQVCESGMVELLNQALQTLQRLASQSTEFILIARAANELGMLVRYGDVQRFDPKPLKPLIDQLFTEGTLLLLNASNCDNDGAKDMINAMSELNKISLEYDQLIDEALWINKLHKLSDADHLNPLLSGYACAILLERNLINNDDLAREVSRRLSPGIDADIGAGWFEGLSKRNRYALLARLSLWQQLAEYVSALDDEQFSRALVFLRRAFSDFNPREKRNIAENLGEIWGVSVDGVSELMGQSLTQEEKETLDQLNDFDFDDL